MNNTNYRNKVMEILLNQLRYGMEPYWFITYHYKENKSNEDEAINDVRDIKNKLKSLIYQSRDKSVIGAGEFEYPKMVFVNERSRYNTDQIHTHMITERLPKSINTQAAVEELFGIHLREKVKSVSGWKRIDVQRISTDESDLYRLAKYLSKQNSLSILTLDPFNSDLQR